MSRSFCTSFVLFVQIICEIILMVVAMQITAICAQESLFDRIGVVSGLKMIGLLYVFFGSMNNKTWGLLIIVGSIVASVYEQEEVAPVDQQCTIAPTDYFKKDLVIFLFAMYGVATELRYIWYFISLFFYMREPSTVQKEKETKSLPFYQAKAESTHILLI